MHVRCVRIGGERRGGGLLAPRGLSRWRRLPLPRLLHGSLLPRPCLLRLSNLRLLLLGLLLLGLLLWPRRLRLHLWLRVLRPRLPGDGWRSAWLHRRYRSARVSTSSAARLSGRGLSVRGLWLSLLTVRLRLRLGVGIVAGLHEPCRTLHPSFSGPNRTIPGICHACRRSLAQLGRRRAQSGVTQIPMPPGTAQDISVGQPAKNNRCPVP